MRSPMVVGRQIVRRYPATLGLVTVLVGWYLVQHHVYPFVVTPTNGHALELAIAIRPENPFAFGTYLTALVSHFSLRHLLLNLCGLAAGGFVVERKLGSRTVVGVFFATGVLSILSYVVMCSFVAQCGYGLGASGGVYGLYGATLAFVAVGGSEWFQDVVAFACLVAVFEELIVLVPPIAPAAAITAGIHLTGAVTGICIFGVLFSHRFDILQSPAVRWRPDP